MFNFRQAPLLPVIPGTKTPMLKDWVNAASSDPQKHLEWFVTGRNNVGVVTGLRSRFWVLDVDPRHDGDASLAELERQHGPLPTTIEQITAHGGRHLLFQMPENGEDIRNATAILPGLDIRGTGGYILVEPSWLRGENGEHLEYHWEESGKPNEVPLAHAPEWLLKLVRNGQQGRVGQPVLPDEPIPEGSRELTLFRAASSMRRAGFSPEGILAAIHVENAGRCHPPLTNREVDAIAEDVAKRYAAGTSPAVPPPPKDPSPLGIFADAHRLTDVVTEATQKAIVRGVLYPGGISMMVGEPSVGKSWLAMEMIRGITQERLWLGLPCQSQTVLYLGYEMEFGYIKERMEMLGYNDETVRRLWIMSRTQLRGYNVLDPTALAALQAFVAQEQIGVVVVDALANAHHLDENYSGDMVRLLQAFAGLGAAVLVLHHVDKTRSETRGSSAIGGYVDAILNVSKIDDHMRVRWEKEPRFESAPRSIECERLHNPATNHMVIRRMP